MTTFSVMLIQRRAEEEEEVQRRSSSRVLVLNDPPALSATSFAFRAATFSATTRALAASTERRRRSFTSSLVSAVTSRYGLTGVARHVIDTLVEPSFLELHGILRRGEQCLSGPTSRLRRPRVRAGQILHATS